MASTDQPVSSPAVRSSPRSVFALAIGALTVLALGRWAAGLDPRSLWLDDQWVGLVVRRMSFSQFFALRPPTPLGFVAVEKLAAQLGSDPEWPLQLFPLVCALAQIPLLAALVFAITGRRALGVLAAALLTVDPLLAELSVRVKQYTADGLATIVLLWIGMPLLERWTPRRAGAVACAGVLAIVFSFPSVFVSAPLLHLALALALQKRERGARIDAGAIATVLAFDLVLALMYFGMLRGQGGSAMTEYWHKSFLPLDVHGALSFLQTRGFRALKSALPPALAPVLVLLPLGLFDLARRPQRRGLALLLFAFYLEWLCVSALRLYPLGGGRTDSFAHPVTLVLIVTGLRALVAWPSIERHADLGMYALAAALVLGFGTPAAYPPSDDAPMVKLAEQVGRPEDGLVIYPHAALAVGYYSAWPTRLVPWLDYAHGFHVEVDRPRTLTLSPHAKYWERHAALDRELTSFLATPYERVFYLAGGWLEPATHAWLLRRLHEHGYRAGPQTRGAGAALTLFVRARDGDPSSPRGHSE